MGRFSRFALGTLQPEVDSQPLAWALLEALSRRGLQVQHFLSRACFTAWDAAPVITGSTPAIWTVGRCLPKSAGRFFSRGAEECDLAVVEGTFARELVATTPTPSRLDPLCHWLALPRIGVLDVSRLGGCRLPPRPENLDGLLLDQVQDRSDFYRWQTCIESLWGVSVLGALERLPRLRRAIAELPFGSAPQRELCQSLGENLTRWTDIDRLLRLASAAVELESPPAILPSCEGRAVRVAVAYDSAFHCYFPDTLDLLELCGATVVNFSPLRDECLPPETDVVYLGCGHPERFASELEANCCIQTALRNHICSGRRLYAEGGGLAYLCRYIEDLEGRCLPMAGLLPAVARLNPEPVRLDPVEAQAGPRQLARTGRHDAARLLEHLLDRRAFRRFVQLPRRSKAPARSCRPASRDRQPAALELCGPARRLPQLLAAALCLPHRRPQRLERKLRHHQINWG